MPTQRQRRWSVLGPSSLKPMRDPTRLVLIYGGPSAEHDVSRVSALHVSRAIDRTQFDVHIIGVSRGYGWVDATSVAGALDERADSLPSPDDLDGLDRLPRPLFEAVAGREDTAVVFPLIHGTMGEDGTLQGLIEASGLACVGAGVLASAVCMEKHIAKAVLKDAGVSQTPFAVLRSNELSDHAVKRIGDQLGYPAFVKPSGQGSSVGVSKVHTDDAMAKALRVAFEYGDVAVVEAFVDGREIELAVMGNDDPMCTVPGEIVPSQDFYDYEDKYSLGQAELRIPAPLDSGIVARAREIALRTYRLLEVEGYARVDAFVAADGTIHINEVNTIPGFTPISMFPKLWEHEGVAYGELISRLVGLARERHARRHAWRRSL